MNELEALREEVQRLSLEVSAQREARGRRNRALVVLGGCAALVSVVATAAPYDCSSGALGRGLFCFSPDQPAIASQVNGNFYALSGALDAGEVRLGAHDATLAALTSRVTALENNLAPLSAREKVVSGTANFTNPSCASAGAPCDIVFPAGTFTQPPRCVLTMRNVDGTGYQEHMVIKDVVASKLSIWEGQYYNQGTSMSVHWICSGN